MSNRFAALVACLILAAGSFVSAQTVRQKETSGGSDLRHVRWVFSSKLGILGAGDINVKSGYGEGEFGIESGLSGGFSLEFPTSKGVSSAITFDFHKLDPEYYRYTKTLLDFGVLVKGSARNLKARTLVRPFVGVSYGYLGEVAWLDPSHYLIVKGGLELDFFPNYKGVGWLVELGLLGSPHGKADRYDITAEARPYIRFGLIVR
jgi:hypothetical protein